jgi:hypothetical protein
MHGRPDASELEMPFTDITDASLWYYDAIKWAADNGIALGFDDGTFGPNINVTREQMAALLYRYADYINAKLPEEVEYEAFADQTSISPYAVVPVEALYKANIIQGMENNRFEPMGNATRAQYAAVLHRYLERATVAESPAPPSEEAE